MISSQSSPACSIQNLPVTRILDALVDTNSAGQSYGMGRAGSAAAVAAMQAVGVGSNDPFAGVYEEYRYMDPKILRPTAEKFALLSLDDVQQGCPTDPD